MNKRNRIDMKLISMTYFVLSQENKGMQNTDRHLRFDKVLRYAKFLKQPLTLSMFIPCDLDGNILGEPIRGFEESDKDYLEFVKAKERVLFKGFTYVKDQKTALLKDIKLSVSPYADKSLYITHKMNGSFHTWFDLHTIEDLIKCDLELSESVIKKLEL